MAACSDDTTLNTAGLYLDDAVISTKVRAVSAEDKRVIGRDIGGGIGQGVVDLTGEGLPSEKRAQLFQPFDRLNHENTAEERTGIGVAVSKRLAELMGGTIGVQSAVGVGGEFWVDFAQGDRPEESLL
jgi:light-regulated signal transduction histidine kinase (bacteriophytochrome)